MPAKRILILGGTGEARQLAALLVNAGHDVMTFLAGATEHPVLPEGKVQIGGMGGVLGLKQYIVSESIEILIDATHPFAGGISLIAYYASIDIETVTLLRLERAEWQKQKDDIWIEVDSVKSAVEALPLGSRIMLTIGRKWIEPFMARSDLSGLVRMIEAPSVDIPQSWRLVRERPPFSVEGEMTLMIDNNISHIVSKNSGGAETESKIVAARKLKIPVVMISRPNTVKVSSFGQPEEIAFAVSKLGSDAMSG